MSVAELQEKLKLAEQEREDAHEALRIERAKMTREKKQWALDRKAEEKRWAEDMAQLSREKRIWAEEKERNQEGAVQSEKSKWDQERRSLLEQHRQEVEELMALLKAASDQKESPGTSSEEAAQMMQERGQWEEERKQLNLQVSGKESKLAELLRLQKQLQEEVDKSKRLEDEMKRELDKRDAVITRLGEQEQQLVETMKELEEMRKHTPRSGGSSATTSEPHAGVGMVVRIDSRHAYPLIKRISAQGAAAECGKLAVGDVLLEVDAVDCKHKTIEEMSALFLGPAGSTVVVKGHTSETPDTPSYTVTLVRGGEGHSPLKDALHDLEEERGRCQALEQHLQDIQRENLHKDEDMKSATHMRETRELAHRKELEEMKSEMQKESTIRKALEESVEELKRMLEKLEEERGRLDQERRQLNLRLAEEESKIAEVSRLHQVSEIDRQKQIAELSKALEATKHELKEAVSAQGEAATQRALAEQQRAHADSASSELSKDLKAALSAKDEAVGALKEAAAALQEAEKQSAQAESASNDLAQALEATKHELKEAVSAQEEAATQRVLAEQQRAHADSASSELSKELDTTKQDLKAALSAKEEAVGALKEAAAALKEAEKQSAQAESSSNDLAQALEALEATKHELKVAVSAQEEAATQRALAEQQRAHADSASSELSTALDTAKQDLKAALFAKEEAVGALKEAAAALKEAEKQSAQAESASNDLAQALETAKHDLKVAIAAKETAEKKLGERTSKSHAAADDLVAKAHRDALEKSQSDILASEANRRQLEEELERVRAELLVEKMRSHEKQIAHDTLKSVLDDELGETKAEREKWAQKKAILERAHVKDMLELSKKEADQREEDSKIFNARLSEERQRVKTIEDAWKGLLAGTHDAQLSYNTQRLSTGTTLLHVTCATVRQVGAGSTAQSSKPRTPEAVALHDKFRITGVSAAAAAAAAAAANPCFVGNTSALSAANNGSSSLRSLHSSSALSRPYLSSADMPSRASCTASGWEVGGTSAAEALSRSLTERWSARGSGGAYGRDDD